VNPFTRSDVKATAGIAAIIFAALVGGMAYSERTITLAWEVNNPPGEVVTEVWSCTNLAESEWPWRRYAEVAGSNLTVSVSQPQRFFIIRNRSLITGDVSDWDRKR
jgi:hypothetical protein